MRTRMSEDQDYKDEIAALPDGWVTANAVVFTRATASEVVAELTIGPQHLQPMGIVHGGVYAGLVETTTSVGAGIHSSQKGRLSVGLENHTSFLHASRSGKLIATARPLTRGSRTQVWEASVVNEAGQVAATGRVRFLTLDPGTALAGEGAGMKPST